MTGLKWGEDNLYGCPLCRTCRFDNVCFNHSSQDVQFYVDDAQSPLFYEAANGEPHYEFPPDFINTGHLSMSPSPMDWAPKAVAGSIPEGAVFSDAPVVAYVSLNDAGFNFGHALFDFLFPVFNTLQLLDVYHPDFQLLLAKHQGKNPHLIELFIDPAEADRSMLPMISRRSILTLDSLAAQAAQAGSSGQADGGLTCFSSFVAGSGSLHTSMQRTRALPFREAAFANLGIVEDSQRSTPRITMLKKKGKRIPPTADFETLEGEAIATMSVKQQVGGSHINALPIQLEATSQTDTLLAFITLAAVEAMSRTDILIIADSPTSRWLQLEDMSQTHILVAPYSPISCLLQLEAMSRTDILITPCGGVGTVLTFLPVGATAIVMNYWHTTLQTSVQMERNYYWNLEYLDIQFFPVLAEDYELTTDRPRCEKGTDDPFLKGQKVLTV
ncbi:MAG: hypothetical protein FRX49_11851 [Trebouxia sp. A1-2]|nr:MAG: hypothetical protein FRX49_11851 [Trebouxia sp. A1-2]